MPMLTARVRRLALIQDRGSVCRGVGNLVILCEPVGSWAFFIMIVSERTSLQGDPG